jgi:predicted DNA-binding transcriptional regulator AlpA
MQATSASINPVDSAKFFDQMQKLMADFSVLSMMDEKELSTRWGISVRTLQNWRNNKKGPTYVKLNSDIVRYKISDVIEYENRTVIQPA